MAMEMYNSIPTSYLWVVPNKGHSAGIRGDSGREIFLNTAIDFFLGNWEE